MVVALLAVGAQPCCCQETINELGKAGFSGLGLRGKRFRLVSSSFAGFGGRYILYCGSWDGWMRLRLVTNAPQVVATDLPLLHRYDSAT